MASIDDVKKQTTGHGRDGDRRQLTPAAQGLPVAVR